jgi:16S rRNA (guanine527-N7)-methyltransferase
VFPSARLPLAQRYADLLGTDGVLRGLIGPREGPRLWDRHLLNCAVLSDLVPQGATVADVGSGAGLPGLVLAIARPDLEITLVEPLLRRTTFLDEVVAGLGLDVEVMRARAERVPAGRTFDVVTSRAVAPLDRLLRWSMPLVAPTGALVAMKGSSVRDEIRAAAGTLADLGCAEPEVHTLGEGRIPSPTTAVRVSWAEPAAVGWQPRAAQVSRSVRGAGPRRTGSGRRGR